VRSIASMKTGLPIGIFRLVTQDGREMFDGNRLDDYGVDIGHTIMLENWDGWNEYLNLAIMGFTPQ
ncbi:protein ankub1, partial [Biomphalaria glabrata]